MVSAYFVILVFLVAALVVLAIVWWLARRVKEEVDDTSRIVAGARSVVEVRPQSAAQLRSLSSEPILLKQTEQGVRVQIEHKPMMPLMAFVGNEVSAAIQEAAGAVTERYGMDWVVLLSADEDGHVTVQRLA